MLLADLLALQFMRAYRGTPHKKVRTYPSARGERKRVLRAATQHRQRLELVSSQVYLRDTGRFLKTKDCAAVFQADCIPRVSQLLPRGFYAAG